MGICVYIKSFNEFIVVIFSFCMHIIYVSTITKNITLWIKWGCINVMFGELNTIFKIWRNTRSSEYLYPFCCWIFHYFTAFSFYFILHTLGYFHLLLVLPFMGVSKIQYRQTFLQIFIWKCIVCYRCYNPLLAQKMNFQKNQDGLFLL